MAAIPDLFGQEESKLFQELYKLSGLSDQHKIDAPSLIVVGDQNSGKSSVLEALARFRFPVSEDLCTTFPIRLVLKRSHQARTYIISPIQRQTISPHGSEERVQRSTQEAIERYQDYLQGLSDTSNANQDGLTCKAFSGSDLTIERCGRDVPFLEITDLPGLFSSATKEQDENGRKIVNALVERRIKSKRNVVILVIHGRSEYATQLAPDRLSTLMRKDESLKDRTIGVLTHADHENGKTEAEGLINRKVDQSNFKYGWHVLRNQSKDERLSHSLEDRDRLEEHLFNSEEWSSISADRKGIQSLRISLRKVLRKHIKNQLPDLSDEISATIKETEKKISTLGPLRNDTADKRRFLCDIARNFEQLAREAIQGTYNNPRCKQKHSFEDANCQSCIFFFPRFNEVDLDSQRRRLRATIRSRNREFSETMYSYGKTVAVQEDQTSAKGVSPSDENDQGHREEYQEESQEEYQEEEQEDMYNDESSMSSLPSVSFPLIQRATSFVSVDSAYNLRKDPIGDTESLLHCVMRRFNEFEKTRTLARKDFEKLVMPAIESWRAGEPRGEASDAAFDGLFEYQSANWEMIAQAHVDIVWKLLLAFNNSALKACCSDEILRRSIRKHITNPRLDNMRKEADLLFRKLLSCHRRGNTGFHDAFTDMVLVRGQCKTLASRLTDALQSSSPEKETDLSDQIKSTLQKQFVSGALQALKLESPAAAKIMDVAMGIVNDALESEKTPMETKNLDSIGLYPTALEKFAATRVIDQVEARYLMNMIAFVSYVNSLVVEGGLLGELPDSVFTQQIVMDLDDATINKIAAEAPDISEERERLQADLEILKSVYNAVEEYRFGHS